MAEAPRTNGGTFERWVIDELRDIKTDVRHLRETQLPGLEDKLTNARLDIRELQTRALIGGGIAGLFISALVTIFLHLVLGG